MTVESLKREWWLWWSASTWCCFGPYRVCDCTRLKIYRLITVPSRPAQRADTRIADNCHSLLEGYELAEVILGPFVPLSPAVRHVYWSNSNKPEATLTPQTACGKLHFVTMYEQQE